MRLRFDDGAWAEQASTANGFGLHAVRIEAGELAGHTAVAFAFGGDEKEWEIVLG